MKNRSCSGVIDGSTPTSPLDEYKKSSMDLVVELGNKVSLCEETIVYYILKLDVP